MKKIPKHYLQTLSLGAIAGMRSMAAVALISDAMSKKASPELAGPLLNFIQSDKVAIGLKGLSAAEIAGDKLPSVPDRIVTPSLVVRGISGAIAGSVLFKINKDSAVSGALLGTAAAIAASYGAFYLRNFLVEKFNIADPVIGSLEDALVIKTGTAALEV